MTHYTVGSSQPPKTGVNTGLIVLIAVGALVVLLAIVAVLAAILFPVFARARERAELTTCINNQKQIALGAMLYADDWNSTLPDVGTYSGGGQAIAGTWTQGRFWGDAIADYLRDTSAPALTCPAAAKGPSPSYAWNRHLSRVSLRMISAPVACPLLWDWVPGQQTAPGIPLYAPENAGAWKYYPSVAGVSRDQMTEACSRHRNGLVVCFVDGHARWMQPTLWTPQRPTGAFMPSDDKAMPGPPPQYADRVISMYPWSIMAR